MMDLKALTERCSVETAKNIDRIIFYMRLWVLDDLESFCNFMKENADKLLTTPTYELQENFLSQYLGRDEVSISKADAETMFDYFDNVFDFVTNKFYDVVYDRMLKEEE